MRIKGYMVVGITVLLLAGCSLSVFGQDQTNNSKPDVQISVHKQTDANGNIISYDSTYTYIYSGKCHNSAYVDSILKRNGINMNTLMFSVPLNTPDFSNYPFILQFGSADYDKMQQMMQNQMNEMMQMYGTPPCNGFFCQPPPTPQCCPKDSVQYRTQQLDKKNCPKHNKVKGGVQI